MKDNDASAKTPNKLYFPMRNSFPQERVQAFSSNMIVREFLSLANDAIRANRVTAKLGVDNMPSTERNLESEN